MEIIDRIKSSPQNLRAAKEIHSNFDEALWSLKKECFARIEEKIYEMEHIGPYEKASRHYAKFKHDQNTDGTGLIYNLSNDKNVLFSFEKGIFYVGYCNLSEKWINPHWEACTIEYEPATETIYELCDNAKMEK